MAGHPAAADDGTGTTGTGATRRAPATACGRRQGMRTRHASVGWIGAGACGMLLATAAALVGTLTDPDSFLRSRSRLLHSGISVSAVFANKASLPTGNGGFSSLEAILSSLFAIRASLPAGTDGFSFSLEARRSSTFAITASLFMTGTGGLSSLEGRRSSLFDNRASLSADTGDTSLSRDARRSSSLFFQSGTLSESLFDNNVSLSASAGDTSLSLNARRSSSLFFQSGTLSESLLATLSSFICSLATVS